MVVSSALSQVIVHSSLSLSLEVAVAVDLQTVQALSLIEKKGLVTVVVGFGLIGLSLTVVALPARMLPCGLRRGGRAEQAAAAGPAARALPVQDRGEDSSLARLVRLVLAAALGADARVGTEAETGERAALAPAG
eukprot:scaffold22620_cov59-Phaeocystis_antarctica.AAC.1